MGTRRPYGGMYRRWMESRGAGEMGEVKGLGGLDKEIGFYQS